MNNSNLNTDESNASARIDFVVGVCYRAYMTAEEMAARRWAKTPPGPERTELARKAATVRWLGHIKQGKKKPRPLARPRQEE